MIDAQRIATENERHLARHELRLAHALETLDGDGVDAEAVITGVAAFSVAAPSWALGTGGTRFGRFPGGGEPRTIEEKVDDVAALTALTGANRTISIHVPWDELHDPAAVRAYAAERRIGFDVINSNTFQDNPLTTAGGSVSYKFGSLCHAEAAVRRAGRIPRSSSARMTEAAHD